MRRSHIVLLIVAASIGLLLITVSAVTEHGYSLAAPLRQTTNESEPNNSCSEADEIGLAASMQGAINPITDTDWFSVTTQAGSPYIASASVGPAEFSIRLCVHDNNCAQMYCSAASSSYIEQSWNATGNTHYVKIEKYGSALITQTTSYVLEVVEEYVPPATDTPTPTPTPTNTPLPSITEKDKYEDNNDKDHAYTLPVATSVTLSTLEGLANFYPDNSDEDWFRFWAKNTKWYQVTTSDLSGVDTYLEIRDQNNNLLKSDDDGAGGLASQTSWQATYDGYYYIRVTNRTNTSGAYNMSVQESDAPPADATATPGPGPSSEADDCEDNLDFDHACVIATNKSYTFNLHPPFGGMDNDYYKLWVKPGFIYECATSNLDPGIDPNMIVYDHNQNGLGGNDDVELGNLNSAFSYYAAYEGWMYVLVGTGDRTPSDINNSNYTLLCNMQTPGQPTSTPDPEATNTPSGEATPTPKPTSPPDATPIPPEEITIHPMTTPTPALPPGPDVTPAPRFIPINLLVYYDSNDDHQPGAGEGISGVSAQVYEAAANQLLAQGFTDEQGNVEFTVAAQGPVRVSIPFFGFSQLVAGEEGASIYLRIPPQTLPGEAP